MRFRIIGIVITYFFILFSLPVLPQEKAVYDKTETADISKIETIDKDPSKLWVDLSGLMYFEWGYFSGFNNGDGNRWNKVARWGIDDTNYPVLSGAEPTNIPVKNNNTFRMQRAYITLKKDIGDMFSVKLTTDIQPTSQDFIFLKYGFVQFYKEFFTPYGPIFLKAQGGKIATPNEGITDWLSDLRWISDNYLGKSRTILNGKSFDNPADFGGYFSIGLFQMVRLEYTYTNGEGYKFDNSETYTGKAHTVLASINPEYFRIKELFLNFYGRWEDTNKNRLDNSPLPAAPPIKYSGIESRSYMGFGVAWRSELIKIGINFFMPEMHFSKTVFILPITSYATGHKEKFYLLDSWLNFNLGAVVRPAPILIVGRFAWGREKKNLIGNERQERDTLVAAGGAGYQFNQYFRMVLYYEYIKYHLAIKIGDFTKRDPTPNQNIYLKAEVKY